MRRCALSPPGSVELRQWAPSPDAFGGGLRLVMHDGRALERELRYQRGGAEDPLTADEVLGKLRTNAGMRLADEDVSGLEKALLGSAHETDTASATVLRRAAGGKR